MPLITWKDNEVNLITLVVNCHQNHLSGNISVYFSLSSTSCQKFNLQVDLINYFYKLLNESVPKAKRQVPLKELLHSWAGFYKDVKKYFVAMIHTLMLL